MKLTSIEITDFRGLRNVSEQNLDPRMNLFVGINGAGKSSILDSIANVFSWYIARIQSAKGRGKDIPKDDISHGSVTGCNISLTIDGSDVWTLYRSLKYKKEGKSSLADLNRRVQQYRSFYDNGRSINLPVIAYYNVNRTIPNKYPHKPRSNYDVSVLSTYNNALTGSHLFSDFFNWFRMTEDLENEMFKKGERYDDSNLTAVREAMHLMFSDYTDLKVNRRPLSMTMQKNGEIFKISQLSDGEKCYITMVCDLARRLAIANPSGNPLNGEGIVLIDEVDLHLHPKWQQTVLSNLTKTFPNCQFFVTTHSPIVASDALGKVWGLKDGKLIPKQTYGKLSSNILSEVFDISMARNLYVQSLIDKAYKNIHDGLEQSYNANVCELTKILGEDDIELAKLKIEKIRWSNRRKA